MKRIFLIFVLALLVFSACSKKAENKTLNSLNDENKEKNQAEESTSTETIGNTQTSEKKKDAGLSDFFKNMPKLAEYKATYEYTFKPINSATNLEEKFTLAIKGNNFKYVKEGTSIYNLDDKTYMCVIEEETICYEFEQTEKQTIEKEQDLRENWEKYNLVELPSRKIGSENARCFGYEISGIKIEYCYSKYFVPIFLKENTKEGEITMIAIDYSNKVSDSEFTLPAKPQKFGIV